MYASIVCTIIYTWIPYIKNTTEKDTWQSKLGNWHIKEGKTDDTLVFHMNTLKFDRHLCSSAAEMPVTFESDTIIITSIFTASRLHKKSCHLVNRDTGYGSTNKIKMSALSIIHNENEVSDMLGPDMRDLIAAPRKNRSQTLNSKRHTITRHGYGVSFNYLGDDWTLQWCHNWRDSVPNHQPHDCLLNRLFRRRSKKTSKLRVTGPCEFTGDRWISRTNGQ